MRRLGFHPWTTAAVAALSLAGAGACARSREGPAPSPLLGSPRVVVLQNLADPVSRRLAARYARARQLRPDQLATIDLVAGEEVSLDLYRRAIEAPVRAHLERTGRRESTDFLLTTKGVPLRIRETGGSVDALLGAMDLPVPAPRRQDPASFAAAANPYFASDRPFSRRAEGFYLVTRLDGYDERAARALIERATRAHPAPGPFLIDLDPRREAYGGVQPRMRRAAARLRELGFQVELDTTAAFVGASRPLAGYYSWGSNDGSFDARTYRSLRFLPGALAETAVSSSGRTFRRSDRGQSLIADLIEGGVTGAKGYVSEPLTSGLCPADLLFDRYVRGYTLAESFGQAMPFVKWKDVVLGDPLCAPYATGDAP